MLSTYHQYPHTLPTSPKDLTCPVCTIFYHTSVYLELFANQFGVYVLEPHSLGCIILFEFAESRDIILILDIYFYFTNTLKAQ